MRKIRNTLLFLSLFLAACSPNRLSSEAPPTSVLSPATENIPVSTTEILPPPKLIATLATPHIDPGPNGAVTDSPSYPQGCGYQWAQQDLPELSSDFQQSIQGLQPEARAYAFAFGENCMGADGNVVRFIPMETDFSVTVQVSNSTNISELGEWMVKVMKVIENIPPDQIVGPRPGRVTLSFQHNDEQIFINFYIDQYHALPAGLSNAEIYQALQSPQ